LETEVPIIDTKLMKRTHEEIDLQIFTGESRKRRGISLLDAQKINARKKLFRCNDGE
jgi:hypothetical protein